MLPVLLDDVFPEPDEDPDEEDDDVSVEEPPEDDPFDVLVEL